jgi:hypothetical protein
LFHFREVTSGFQCVHFSVSSCSYSLFASFNETQSYSYYAVEMICPHSNATTPAMTPPTPPHPIIAAFMEKSIAERDEKSQGWSMNAEGHFP